MTTASDLANAIDRSRTHNEIVTVSVDGSAAEVLAVLRSTYPGTVGSLTLDDGRHDIWGVAGDGDSDEMDWRLLVDTSK